MGSGGRRASAPMKARVCTLPVTTGVHSRPVPGVRTSGAARSTGTRTTCRRSTSSAWGPVFPAKTRKRPSGLSRMYSAM